MRIQIDHTKIGVGPKTDFNIIDESLADQAISEQFVQEIQNSHANSYLLAGYRGSGKTSLINSVESALTSPGMHYHFVRLNLNKFDDYNLFLRRVVRELYLTISANSKFWNEAKKNHGDFYHLFRKLYLQTFNVVTESRTSGQKTENSTEATLGFDITKLSSLLIGCIGVIAGVTSENILPATVRKLIEQNDLRHISSATAAVFSVALLTSIAGKIDWKELRWRSSKSEVDIRSIYDVEIAEYQLFSLLRRLQKIDNSRLIIVLDELDKLPPDQITTLVTELKPLILSPEATFILVGGHDLLINYISSFYSDDSVISSLFSRVIPVSLPNSYFRTIILSVDDETAYRKLSTGKKEAIRRYVETLAITACCVPRKFFSLLQQRIVWEDNKAYIAIDEFGSDYYFVVAAIAEAIKKIEEKSLDYSGHFQGINILLSTKISRVAGRLLDLTDQEFTKSDLVAPELAGLPDILAQVWEEFDDIVDDFLEYLLTEGVITKITSIDGEPRYRITTSNPTATTLIRNAHLGAELEAMIKEIELFILSTYHYLERSRQSTPPIEQVIERLMAAGLVNPNTELFSAVLLALSLRHPELITLAGAPPDPRKLTSLSRNANLRYRLIEELTIAVLQRGLRDYQYAIQSGKRIGLKTSSRVSIVDAIAYPADKQAPILLFEIKYASERGALFDRIAPAVDRVLRLIDSVEEAQASQENADPQPILAVVIFFVNGSDSTINSFNVRAAEHLKILRPEVAEQLRLVTIPVQEKVSLFLALETQLKEIFRKP